MARGRNALAPIRHRRPRHSDQRTAHTIVGVMPPSFAPRLLVTFNERGVWAPKVWAEYEYRLRGARISMPSRGSSRRHDRAGQSELDGIAERLAQQYPGTNRGKTIQLVTFRDHLAGDLRSSMNVLRHGATPARDRRRELGESSDDALHLALREIGVRSALVPIAAASFVSCSPRRSACGTRCVLGLLVAYGTARLIVWLAPGDIPGLSSVGLNNRVLLFSTALTFIVTVLTGIVPAWRGSAFGRPRHLPMRRPVMPAASESHRPIAVRGRGARAGARPPCWWRPPAAEFAVLIATSPGFAPEGVAALQIFARCRPQPPAQTVAFYQQTIDG